MDPPVRAAGDEVPASTRSDASERVELETRLRRLSAIVESTHDAIVGGDLRGVITSWNRSAQALFGWTPEEALGQQVGIIVPPGSDDGLRAIARDVRRGRFSNLEAACLRKDGSFVDCAITVSPVPGPDGDVVGGSLIARDITEQRRLRREVARDRERLAEAQRIAGLGSYEMDLDTGIATLSDELYRIIGVDPRLGVVPTLEAYLDVIHPADRLTMRRAWRQTIDEGVEYHTTHRIVRPDGEVRWIEARGHLIDASRRVRGTSLDVTEAKRAEAALAHQGLHDPLTGLANRRLLADRLEQAVRRSAHRHASVAVLVLDIDRFKLVNDALGHAGGDGLLTALAGRLRGAGRSNETVARSGADEFTVVCEDVTGAWQAATIAERYLQLIGEPVVVDGHDLRLTASIGVAIGGAENDPSGLLRDANTAMYQAKARGRARIELFDETLRAEARGRLDMDAALRRALTDDELWVAYQPIVRLADEMPVGIEALVRWTRPDGTVVMPSDFIPAAEENGLIAPIGGLVMRQALRDLAALRTAHPLLHDLQVSVNVSAHQFGSADLLAMIEDGLRATALAPDALEVEMTESVLMDDIEHSVGNLSALRAIGVRLAIDDFGTGYSSLSYLSRFPLDTMKVDRVFVDGLGDGSHDSSIVEAITGLGRALGLVVLAEGVETVAQRDRLATLGCQLGQGFLWSRAVPVDALREWLVAAVAPGASP